MKGYMYNRSESDSPLKQLPLALVYCSHSTYQVLSFLSSVMLGNRCYLSTGSYMFAILCKQQKLKMKSNKTWVTE